jgi:hypothetical protein
MDEHDVLAERFEAHRSRLRAVAYQTLGSVAEFQTLAATARSADVEVEFLSPAPLTEPCPRLDWWVPSARRPSYGECLAKFDCLELWRGSVIGFAGSYSPCADGCAPVRASSSAETSAVSAAPIRWNISSACRRRTPACVACPAARAQRPRPASA